MKLTYEQKKQFFFSFLLLITILTLSITVGYADSAAAAAKIGVLSNKYLYPVVETIGDVFLVLGVWKFGIAMTSDQAEQLSKGIAELAAGAVLANIRTFMGDSTQLKDVLKTIESVIQVIGAVVAIYGGLSTGLGFAQDNSDGISKGLKLLIGGAIAFSVTTILKWVKVT